MNSIIEFQQKTTLPLSKMGEVLAMIDKDFATLRYVMWLGLKKEDPALTEEMVGDLLSAGQMIDVALQVVKYLMDSLGITPEDLKNVEWAGLQDLLKNLTGAGEPPLKPGAEPESPQEISTI